MITTEKLIIEQLENGDWAYYYRLPKRGGAGSEATRGAAIIVGYRAMMNAQNRYVPHSRMLDGSTK